MGLLRAMLCACGLLAISAAPPALAGTLDRLPDAQIAERFAYLPLYARVDTIPGADGERVLLELELIEPNFYLDQVPATTARVADAVIARAEV